jgi:pyruvate dehydrogenase E1 component alpha subunit
MSDPATYRTKDEVEKHKELDPIAITKSRITERGYATEKELNEIDLKIKSQIKEAAAFAESSNLPPLEEMWSDVIS